MPSKNNNMIIPAQHRPPPGQHCNALANPPAISFPPCPPINPCPPIPPTHHSSAGCPASRKKEQQEEDRKEMCEEWTRAVIENKPEFFVKMYDRIQNAVNPDCVVCICGQEFPCHSIALQCYSKFFDRVRRTDDPTKPCQYITLPEDRVTPQAFIDVMNWILLPPPECQEIIRLDNVVDLYLAASFLEIPELECQCLGYIQSDAFQNCLDILDVFSEVRAKSACVMMEVMTPLMAKLFTNIVNSQEFLCYCQEDVIFLLSNDSLVLPSELDVFQAAVHWLFYDWPDRCRHTMCLMQCVRFGQMSTWQLVNIRRNTRFQEWQILLEQFPELIEMIDDGIIVSVLRDNLDDESPDYQSQLRDFGLTIPPARCWINGLPDDSLHVDGELRGTNRNSVSSKLN